VIKVWCLIGLFCLFVAIPYLASAEMYLAGHVGWSMPNDFRDVEGTKGFTGLTLSDLTLQNNLLYGGKLGYFFDSLKWLGVELEAFNATPHLKQQTVSASVFGTNVPLRTMSGGLLRVTTVALNAVVRYPGERVQPYAGVGIGGFFANLEGEGETAVGLNALATCACSSRSESPRL
jgi:opacity protein-like surface antigen